MDWTINLMYAVLLTSITGTILFGFWYVVGFLLEKTGFLNVIYHLMKGVLFFWYFPLVFLILFIGNNENIRWGGFLFQQTPMLRLVSMIFCGIWFLGVGHYLFRYLRGLWLSFKRNRYAIYCDGWEYELFEEVCRELHIKPGKVELMLNIHEDIPKIISIVKPRVILPVREYSREELRIFLLHELTHYKQRDLWLVYFSELAKCFHFFNWFVWRFCTKVMLWGEYACDYDAWKPVGDLKTYFNAIAAMAIDVRRRDNFAAFLVEKKSDLVDRMERMKRSYMMKNKSKFKASILVAAMIVLSTCSVSAATVSAGDAYVKTYYATVVDYVEVMGRAIVMSDDVAQEYEIPAGEFEVEESLGEIDYLGRWGSHFGWTIGGLASKKCSDFSASSGGAISVTASSNMGNSFRMGIIQPDGSRRYVNSSNGVAAHVFELDQTGSYSVFIQNMMTDTIEVAGGYTVQ